jgi:ABC-2 type transport system permease protein
VNAFTGTGSLVRLIFRRDRILMPAWIIVTALLPLGTASGTAGIYPTDQGRAGYINDLGRSALLLVFYGRKPPPDLGSLVFWRLGTGIVVISLIGLLVAIRHTRVEEEAGRRELVDSGVVGRYANLGAAVIATCIACLACGLLVALGMISQHTGVAGSFAMGLAWAFAGITFAGVGAVTAQLSQGAGTARGIGIIVLAASFLLRGLGDVSAQQGGRQGWLSWVPPLGWAFQVNAYHGNRWWLIGLLALLTLALVGAACWLSAHRDVGAGLIQPRPGPAVGAAGLRTPLALAWRLHKGLLISWTVGIGFLGLLLGSVATTAGDLVADNAQLQQYIERIGGRLGVNDVFLSGGFSLAAIMVSGYAVAAALRMRAEESSLRAESVLATAVGRVRWAASHITFALLGPAVAMTACGLAAGVVYGADIGDLGGQVGRVLLGALAQLPAIWVIGALTIAAFGALPRVAAVVGWVALAACLLLGQIGALLGLGQLALDISPFTHIPHLPGGNVSALPLVVLVVIAAALVATGLATLRRRDIPVT